LAKKLICIAQRGGSSEILRPQFRRRLLRRFCCEEDAPIDFSRLKGAMASVTQQLDLCYTEAKTDLCYERFQATFPTWKIYLVDLGERPHRDLGAPVKICCKA